MTTNYFEPHEWGNLEVPKVPTTYHKGIILHCCGVYFDENKKKLVLNTATDENTLKNYILPPSLESWAMTTLSLIDVGLIPFPCDIEFGQLPNGPAYAEIL